MTITLNAPSTSDVLQSMMTENTGRHFLDSGGAYGRHWERNQGIDFLETPKASMSWGPIISTFHYLNDRVSYAPVMDRLFNIFSADSDEPWLVDASAFAEEMNNGYESVQAYNTYNYDNVLSQDIQWVEFTHNNTNYILLQIHGGCDARGGYTKPRVFEVDYGWFGQVNDCEIYCTSCDFGFSIYGGEYVDHDGSGLDKDIDLWASDVVCPECGGPLYCDAPYPY